MPLDGRRTPLTRRTPLVARTPLARGQGLARSAPMPRAGSSTGRPSSRPAASPRPTWPPGVRDAVMARDEHRCGCGRLATEAHHRLPRGRGGTVAAVHAAWGLALCSSCHAAVESQRSAARALGWLVPGGADPAAVPVWRPAHGGVVGHWRQLDEDGGWALATRADGRPLPAPAVEAVALLCG